MSNKRKNILITITAFLVVLIGFGIWFTWTGSTKEIESVANQFKPDSSWKLEDNTLTPPRTVCLDSVCPQVSKRWIKNADTSKSDLDTMIEQANFGIITNGDCGPISESASSYMLCKGEGEYNGYSISVYTVRQSNQQNYTELILNIK